MDNRKDSALRSAVNRMAEAANAVVSRGLATEVAREAVCDALDLMRDRGWPPEQALATCKRVCDHAAAGESDAVSVTNKRAELAGHVVTWLIDCYFV